MEDKGKFMKHALQYVKGTCWAEVSSNSENIRPVTLSAIELHWSEGMHQSVR